MLKRRPDPINPDKIAFRNLNKPISAPRDRVRRPLTAITAKGKRIAQPLPNNHNYYKASKAELLMISDSDYEDSGNESSRKPVPINNYVTEAYDLVDHHKPCPLRSNVTAYTAKESVIPGTSKSTGGANPALGIDYTKRSAGMLTTTLYDEKVKVVNTINKQSQYISPMKPMAAYCGPQPNPAKDPFDRRKVKQLDDISFESDDEIEEFKNYRRLPETVLTEENLKVSLTPSLKALNINNHYWLKNNFINKIGRMAPNLVELSLRGLKVTTDAFCDLVKHMGLLKIIDISNCDLLEEESIMVLADKNRGITRFKASGCPKAITDSAMQHFVSKSKCQLDILDINYCNKLTDEGISAFQKENEEQGFKELYLCGLTSVTNAGFASILSTCGKPLTLLHMALNDQYEVTGEV